MNMKRLDFIKISEWVDPKIKVLDLGCADGTLLKFFKQQKKHNLTRSSDLHKTHKNS